MKLENKKCIGKSKEIAGLLKVSARRILHFVEMGMPKLGRDEYDLIACVIWKAEHDINELKKEMAEKDEDKIIRHQARKEKALAELKEIELEKIKGKIIDTDYAINKFEQRITSAKIKILTWPQIVAPRVVGKGDLKEVKAILKKHVDDVLTDLSKGPIN
jgi:phage terminase Nu1 subunit (DNA packaging protein)